MTDIPGAGRIVGAGVRAVTEGAVDAGVRRAEQRAVTTGANAMAADMLEAEGATAAAVRRAATSATAPGSVLRPQGQTFMNAEHATAARQLDEAVAQRARYRFGSPEYASLTPRVEAAQREVNVFTTQQAVQTAEAGLAQALTKGSESGTRTALLNVANAQHAAGDALVANGRTNEALAWYRRAGQTFARSGVMDLTDHGRGWVSDLQHALNNFGRAGDVQGAVRALGSEGRVEAASGLVGRARSFTDPTLRANTERVARGLIDDARSRPFRMGNGEVIAPRPPLTDGQWARTLDQLRGPGNPDAIRNTILRAP